MKVYIVTRQETDHDHMWFVADVFDSLEKAIKYRETLLFKEEYDIEEWELK